MCHHRYCFVCEQRRRILKGTQCSCHAGLNHLVIISTECDHCSQEGEPWRPFYTCPESSRVVPSHAKVLVKFVLPRFSVRPTAAKTCLTSNSMVCKAVMLMASSTTSCAYATSGSQKPSMRYPGLVRPKNRATTPKPSLSPE